MDLNLANLERIRYKVAKFGCILCLFNTIKQKKEEIIMTFGVDQNNKPTMDNGLTKKQSAFIDYYIETLNGTQSYIKAFSTPSKSPGRRTAEVNSSKLLKHPNVQPIIEERLKAMENERQANAAEVIEFLTKTMRDDNEKTSERIRSAELLGKRHALFVDKLETNQEMDIIVNIIPDDEQDKPEGEEE